LTPPDFSRLGGRLAGLFSVLPEPGSSKDKQESDEEIYLEAESFEYSTVSFPSHFHSFVGKVV